MGSGPSLGNVFHGIMGSSQALVGNQMRKVVQHKIQKQASCRHAAQLPIKSLMSFCTKIWESAIEAVKRWLCAQPATRYIPRKRQCGLCVSQKDNFFGKFWIKTGIFWMIDAEIFARESWHVLVVLEQIDQLVSDSERSDALIQNWFWNFHSCLFHRRFSTTIPVEIILLSILIWAQSLCCDILSDFLCRHTIFGGIAVQSTWTRDCNDHYWHDWLPTSQWLLSWVENPYWLTSGVCCCLRC